MVETLTSLVATKTVDPGDDLVSALIAARDGDERLNQQELLSTIFQLIVAGHDTTASLIENSVVALLRNPDQLAILRADPTKIAAALEEFLRYDAPVPHATFRYALEPIEIGARRYPPERRSLSTWHQPTETPPTTPNPTHSISIAPTAGTSHSVTASTSVSARRSRHGSPTRTRLAPTTIPETLSRGAARPAPLESRRRPGPTRAL